MKKMWFTVLFFLVTLVLAGCQRPNVEIEALSFDVEVIDIDGAVLLSDSIKYEEEDEISIVDLLDEHVDLDYTVHDSVIHVNGIHGIYPTEYGVTYHYYFRLSVDDEVSNVEIQDVRLVDGMKISFIEQSMLDETDRQVDQLIEVFINHHLSTYLNNDTFQYQVLAAVHQLTDRGYATVSYDAYDQTKLSRETISDTFKTAVFESVHGLDLTATQLALSAFTTTNHYEAITLLNALTIADGNTAQINTLIDTLTRSNPEFTDVDYAGMLLESLALYKEQPAVSSTTDDMLTLIDSALSAQGVESWGNANASSTATVILGLLAQGIDPRSEAYTTEGIDLVEALLQYEIDGAYQWLLTDEQADMMFSTPQVFAALVAYKIYRDLNYNIVLTLYTTRS